MSDLIFADKIDVPSAHWDRLFAPSACLVMITTVDEDGRVNAAHLRARMSPSSIYRFYRWRAKGYVQ